MVKFGYVSIIGRPNAGKSTLLNSFVGQKVSIISSKPQTTRNNILGIANGDNYQIVFVDTPGIHAAKNGLDKFMMKSVRTATSDVDMIVYVLDSTKTTKEDEFEYIKNLKEKTGKLIVAVNKTDRSGFEKVYPLLDKLTRLGVCDEIVPISALSGNNVDVLKDVIIKNLPEYEDESVYHFDKDDYTDKSIKFLISEIVREKTLILLSEEIPHGIAVVVSQYEDKGNLLEVEVEIYCERESHKSIIIGKHGEMSKQIGSLAREEIEKLVGKKVLLKIWVRVKKGWKDVQNALKDFGYIENI